MLYGRARNLFKRKGKKCRTFDEGIELSRSCYNLGYELVRLLSEGHVVTPAKGIQERLYKSQLTAFQSFPACLMRLQQKFQKDYGRYRYLRDRPMSAIYIPDIQNALRDRTLLTAHQLVSRVANRPSTRLESSDSEANIPIMTMTKLRVEGILMPQPCVRSTRVMREGRGRGLARRRRIREVENKAVTRSAEAE